ncbi:MAG: glycosyltransferase family 39 protein [Clostridia bacterium]|nr:glycosyltransferase family 39 protein [Clostridia bacterium]
MVCLLLTFYKVLENFSIKKYKFILFFMSIVVYTIWGIFAKTQPVNDYGVLFQGSKQMVEGNFKVLSFDKTNYFYFYNFQIGYVMYLAGLMKIFGDSLKALKIIEIIVMSLTNLLICSIGEKIYSKKIGIMSSLIYMLLLFNVGGSSILNNQHIQAFFICLSIYFFLKEKWQFKIASGITLGISIILRQSSIVILIAYICFILWKLLYNKFKDAKKLIISMCLITFSFIGILGIFDIMTNNVAPNSVIHGNLKYFKFLIGMTGGSVYNIPTESAEKTQVYFDLEKFNFDYDAYNEASKDYLIDSCKNSREVMTFISRKMISFCGEKDNQVEYGWDNIKEGNAVKVVQLYGYVQYVLLVLLSLAMSMGYFIKSKDFEFSKKDNHYIKLLQIIFIGFFLVHIFIEVQPRYRYEQYIMLSLLSAPVLKFIYDKLNDMNEKLNKIKGVEK